MDGGNQASQQQMQQDASSSPSDYIQRIERERLLKPLLAYATKMDRCYYLQDAVSLLHALLDTARQAPPHLHQDICKECLLPALANCMHWFVSTHQQANGSHMITVSHSSSPTYRTDSPLSYHALQRMMHPTNPPPSLGVKSLYSALQKDYEAIDKALAQRKYLRANRILLRATQRCYAEVTKHDSVEIANEALTYSEQAISR